MKGFTRWECICFGVVSPVHNRSNVYLTKPTRDCEGGMDPDIPLPPASMPPDSGKIFNGDSGPSWPCVQYSVPCDNRSTSHPSPFVLPRLRQVSRYSACCIFQSGNTPCCIFRHSGLAPCRQPSSFRLWGACGTGRSRPEAEWLSSW